MGCTSVDPKLNSQHPHGCLKRAVTGQVVAAHAFNPRSGEADADGIQFAYSLIYKADTRAPDLLNSETLSPKTKGDRALQPVLGNSMSSSLGTERTWCTYKAGKTDKKKMKLQHYSRLHKF